jgi:hypothetical protein
MTIAAQKKEENIVEYLLYVWQMQDLLRAADFELAAVRAFLSNDPAADLDLEAELEWFANLGKAIKNAGVQKAGHIPETQEILIELNYLHGTLIDLLKDEKYSEAFKKAQPSLDEFLKRSGNQHMNPIEAGMTALYGLLVLRLQGKEVSQETMGAMKHFQQFLALLAVRYKQMKKGELNQQLN